MEVSDADRELFEDIKAWLKDGHHEGVCPGMIAEFRQKAISTQAAKLDALRGEVVTADHSRTCYARALEKMRIALVNINDGLEDEGDRIYLGSTNHADDIRAAWQIAEALNWDEILEHTQPKTDIAATNFRLQATIAQLRDRVVALEEIPSHIAEQVLSMGRAEWGATSEKTSTEHLADLENTLRLTREKFNLEDIPVQMHGLYLEGAETVLCHTGTSPNSGANAQALVGAWNWLYDQCKARALLTQNEVG